jgi:Leucine-rich repeat (LRR) protein
MGLLANCFAPECLDLFYLEVFPKNFTPSDPNGHPLFLYEILQPIFSYTSQLHKDSASMSQVCKTWQIAIADSRLAKQELAKIESLTYREILKWKSCFAQRYHHSISTDQLLNFCTNLEVLDCSKTSITDAIVQEISKAELPKLTYLNLNFCRWLDQPDLSLFNKNIAVIDLSDCDSLTYPVLPKVDSLRKVNLLKCENLRVSLDELSSAYQLIYIQYPEIHYSPELWALFRIFSSAFIDH